MELLTLNVVLAAIFAENGFEAWSKQAEIETDPDQLRRLALRAVNTSPEHKKLSVQLKLTPLI